MSEEPIAVPAEQAFDLVSLSRYFSELSPQPMVAVEGATHIVRHLNAAFSRLVRKAANELIGRPFAEAVPEGEQNGCLALLDRVYRTGTSEILVEQEHCQTPPVYWSYSVWAILGANECPVGVIIQVTDATEMAIFRKQVMTMNEQLLLSGTRQHELTETADRANQLKDEFLATVSHELRTPLNAIMGWADMLIRGNLDETSAARGLETIARNARAQSQLISDLLDVSRIISGNLRFQAGAVDLVPVIDAAMDTVRPAAGAKGIELQLILDPAAGLVSGDVARLQQIIWNLLTNAVKYTSRNGHVEVRLKRQGSSVVITVSDTGEGISPEFLPYVFDRFRQAEGTTARKHGGLGLGLAIVRHLVEAHGGTVGATSLGVGHGATFTVTFPLIEVFTTTREGKGADANEAPAIHASVSLILNGLRVVVVDDEPDALELLTLVLTQSGAEVRAAATVRGALDILDQWTPDVLVSDIGMPIEDGYDLIRKVREHEPDRGGLIPALAVTGFARPEDVTRARAAGYQKHMSKPVAPSDLVAAVASLATNARHV